jgi:hypothetical protein
MRMRNLHMGILSFFVIMLTTVVLRYRYSYDVVGNRTRMQVDTVSAAVNASADTTVITTLPMELQEI